MVRHVRKLEETPSPTSSIEGSNDLSSSFSSSSLLFSPSDDEEENPQPMENISVELLETDTWKIFNNGKMNEMIITKAGRKLFPVIKFRVRGMNPLRLYSLSLDFQQQNDYRFKYTGEGGWAQAGKAEPPPQDSVYKHPNSPRSGRDWMNGDVDFGKVKVTNRHHPEMIRLNSLHLYEPVVRIHRIDSNNVNNQILVHEMHLPMCQFMAVTSYQDATITEAKIKNNPYAKSFNREDWFLHRSSDTSTGFPDYYRQCSEPSNYTTNSAYYPWSSCADSSQASVQEPASGPVSSTTKSVSSSRYNPYERPTNEQRSKPTGSVLRDALAAPPRYQTYPNPRDWSTASSYYGSSNLSSSVFSPAYPYNTSSNFPDTPRYPFLPNTFANTALQNTDSYRNDPSYQDLPLPSNPSSQQTAPAYGTYASQYPYYQSSSQYQGYYSSMYPASGHSYYGATTGGEQQRWQWNAQWSKAYQAQYQNTSSDSDSSSSGCVSPASSDQISPTTNQQFLY